MVLESIRASWLEHHPTLAFCIGALYTVLAYGIAWVFFRDDPSLPVLFLATLLIVPSLIKVLSGEERQERRAGLRHFFRTHRRVIEIYLFLFLGMFAATFAIAMLTDLDHTLFRYQLGVLEDQQGLSNVAITNFLDATFTPSTAHFLAVFERNALTLLLLFGLSFFYGAGAVFLIALNASVFASFAAYVVRALAAKAVSVWAVLGVFAIHLLPEALAFLLAAIAGGVVSKAVLREKLGSLQFRNVVRDACALMIIAGALLALGAFLEVYVTAQVFRGVF